MLGWLNSAVLISIFGAWIVVKIYVIVTHDILGPAANIVKNGIFVGAWTAITTATGMRAFGGLVRRLRQANKEVGERINPLPADKQIK